MGCTTKFNTVTSWHLKYNTAFKAILYKAPISS